MKRIYRQVSIIIATTIIMGTNTTHGSIIAKDYIKETKDSIADTPLTDADRITGGGFKGFEGTAKGKDKATIYMLKQTFQKCVEG